MCVESDGCEIEGCSSSDEVQTLSGSMSPALKSTAELHPCKPGHKFRAALMRCRTPTAAAGILSFGNVLNYMDRCTVAGVLLDIQRHFDVSDSRIGLLQTGRSSSLILVLHMCAMGGGYSKEGRVSGDKEQFLREVPLFKNQQDETRRTKIPLERLHDSSLKPSFFLLK
ncbi:sphingosine-1-phosphate transporter SPNS2-like [Gadus macrocephalus]|uniref:sphingosine-1-phosphate transporter SPNS2-like n=1 Tax=Gadus macrocephalus TaxID=80720 RepID=UPI0028CB61DF|nr:sphingosine-1-phosphate transporter SPNS2-like [Gadus macrocephalus]